MNTEELYEKIMTDHSLLNGTLTTCGSDPYLIETEETEDELAEEISQYGIKEIKRGTESFDDAVAKLNLEGHEVRHIYCCDGYNRENSIFCLDTDWD